MRRRWSAPGRPAPLSRRRVPGGRGDGRCWPSPRRCCRPGHEPSAGSAPRCNSAACHRHTSLNDRRSPRAIPAAAAPRTIARLPTRFTFDVQHRPPRRWPHSESGCAVPGTGVPPSLHVRRDPLTGLARPWRNAYPGRATRPGPRIGIPQCSRLRRTCPAGGAEDGGGGSGAEALFDVAVDEAAFRDGFAGAAGMRYRSRWRLTVAVLTWKRRAKPRAEARSSAPLPSVTPEPFFVGSPNGGEIFRKYPGGLAARDHQPGLGGKRLHSVVEPGAAQRLVEERQC